MNTEREELLKQNVLRLAREHKRHCDSPDCGISLYFVAMLLDLAGIELTKEESAELI